MSQSPENTGSPSIAPAPKPAAKSTDSHRLQQPANSSGTQQLPKANVLPATDVGEPPIAVDADTKGSVPESTAPCNDDPNIGLNLWHDAYDKLERDENELVQAYRKILVEFLLKEKLEEIKAKLKTEASAEAKAATPNLKNLKAEISDALKHLESQVSEKGSPAGAIDTLAEREELKTKILEELKDRKSVV